MGIIKKTKQYLADKANAAARKLADGVAKTASLSPSQLQKIDQKRDAYFSQKPDMSSEEVQELVQRNIGAVSVEVYQAYLELLKTAYLPMTENVSTFDSYNRIRYFDITKWVADPKEKNLDKLINVYQVLSQEDCNIALIYNRTTESCQVTMAVVNTDPDVSDPTKVKSFYNRIVGAIRGNFPGVELSHCNSTGEPNCLSSITQIVDDKQIVKSVAIVSNLASEKSEDFISQSMEKLLDGIIPSNGDDAYTIVLLAKPIMNHLSTKNSLFELYSALAPYASWQTSYMYTESDALNSSATAGINLGLNIGHYSGTNTNVNVGANIGILNAGISHGINSGNNIGGNFGVNFARTSGVTVQVGKNEGVTQSYTNFGVKHTLEVIEKQIKRLDESAALGMWEFASYVIAKSPVIANNVAHMYLALTQGEESHMTQAAINLWDGEEEAEQAAIILENIKKLQHPVFGLKESIDPDMLMYPTLVTPSAELSGKELAKALNFPRKSVAGFPVIECAEFGRNVVTYDEKENETKEIELGSIFHMHHEENNTVCLEKNSLASHTFITGSTGSGKSNTVYRILDKVRKDGTKFLVIEPAKGEYKHIFGNLKCVSVYGTNPDISPLLRVNPFSFPKGIHILEHLDRLVEIFNVCWPMYAAMPAVLKNAIEKSYEDCGWNLTESENSYGDNLYPQFSDVARNVKAIIDSSEYDTENKGAYKGSLLTRLNSLTNGINGLIFTTDELSMKALFDENAIVDLSRVGSSETKSLIMGMLVLKLQEHRMTQSDMNAPLKHITVLEEAHNLLKRTSTEQVSESANLLGKSVEMISNAIAEMRTYGEGFIIADQSPALLDMAAIRNTNTKIIMRLPDITDRELVGKAANLDENQITELAKLPCGVAAVYQNEWIQPVLCKVARFDTSDAKFEYQHEKEIKAYTKSDDMVKIAELLSNGTKLSREVIHTDILPKLNENSIKASVQVAIAKQLENPPKKPRMTKLAPIVCALFPELLTTMREIYAETHSVSEWTAHMENHLREIVQQEINNQTRRDIIQGVITHYLLNEINDASSLKKWSEKGGLK